MITLLTLYIYVTPIYITSIASENSSGFENYKHYTAITWHMLAEIFFFIENSA